MNTQITDKSQSFKSRILPLDSAQPVPFAIQRALLFAQGQDALEVANHTLTISRQWLQMEQLPVVLAGNVSESSCDAIVAGCNTLADARLIQQLWQHGYVVKQPNEIDLWLLYPLSFGDNQSEPDLDQAVQWVEESVRQVRATLKVQLTVYALLLCEPQHQAIAAQWAKGLQRVCEDRIYLCGPVNQQHLIVENWLQCTAGSLAALLWSDRPAPGRTRWEDGNSCWVTAIGATGWRSPNPQLQKWLASCWIEQQIELLEEPILQETIQETINDAEVPLDWLHSFETMERDLASRVSPIPHPHNQLVRWPRWEQLTKLPSQLQSSLKGFFERRNTQQRAARSLWLAGELERCDSIQSSTRTEPFGKKIENLAGLKRKLNHTAGFLQQLSDKVDQRLEAIEADLQEKAGRCVQMQEEMQQVCSQFPPATLWGLIVAIATPWRWWRWAMLYLFELPECGQRLLDAEIGKAEMLWEQENTLTIRQFLLAMIQDSHQQQNWLRQIEQRMAEIKQLLANQDTTSTLDLLSPWSYQRLQWLANQMAGSIPGWQTRLLDVEMLSKTDAKNLFDRCWQQALSLTEMVSQWSPAALLESALPDPSQQQQWLTQLWESATPLWPSDDLLSNEESSEWLLLPVSEANALSDELPATTQQGTCHFQGLLVVRTVAVNLSGM